MKLRHALAIAVLIGATWLYADTNNTISRLTRGILAIGGTGSTNYKTVVVSDAATNEYRVVAITATVSGTSTISSNTFGTAFLATPTVVVNPPSGKPFSLITNVTVTTTTTGVVLTGLTTNGTTGLNNLPVLVYGTTRTGDYQ